MDEHMNPSDRVLLQKTSKKDFPHAYDWQK